MNLKMAVFNHYLFILQLLILGCYAQQRLSKVQCYRGVRQVADPDDCTIFYKCDYGKPIMFKCPTKTAYNPRLGVCDWDLSRCSKKVQQCWADGEMFKPNPKDCTTFFRCVEGQIKMFKCGQGMHFNEKTKSCERPRRVTPEPKPEPGKMDCSSESPKGWAKVYQNPEDCSTFYTCNQGKPVLTPCPKGYNFNPKRGSCDDTIQPGCKIKNVKPGNYEIYEK